MKIRKITNSLSTAIIKDVYVSVKSNPYTETPYMLQDEFNFWYYSIIIPSKHIEYFKEIINNTYKQQVTKFNKELDNV